jgi:MFS family permease
VAVESARCIIVRKTLTASEALTCNEARPCRSVTVDFLAARLPFLPSAYTFALYSGTLTTSPSDLHRRCELLSFGLAVVKTPSSLEPWHSSRGPTCTRWAWPFSLLLARSCLVGAESSELIIPFNNADPLSGFDTGIATTTIAHESWIGYMGHPSKSLTGAVVAVYIAGEAVGALVQTFIGDRLGRIRFMQLCCVIVTIGTIVQTASVNMGMFLAGRAIAGAAVGGMVSTVPIYLSEISSPQHRGLIGGISGCGISFGTMMSNWVGMACGYAPYGALQWRLPLGIQIPWGIIMFVGLSTFMPNSPRQLIRKGKVEQARTAFTRIRRDLASHEAQEEFALMRAQIEYEMMREIKSVKEIFRLYRHRVLVCIAVQTMTSLTGVNVIQYYQVSVLSL